MGQLNDGRGLIPLAPVSVLLPGGRGSSDDEGGPGDTPVSVRWLRAETGGHGGRPSRTRGGGEIQARGRGEIHPALVHPPRLIDGERVDRDAAEVRPPFPSAVPLPAVRKGQAEAQATESGSAGVTPTLRLVSANVDEALPSPDATAYGPPSRTDTAGGGSAALKAPHQAATVGTAPSAAAPTGLASVTSPRPSTIGLSPWERWLELTARIAEFPRHLSIHTGGMLVTAAPLVDIAPLERATMPGRVVVQYDKRDVETIKLIKLDLLGLRMLSAIDDALRDIQTDCAVHVDLDRLPEDIPDVFRMICAADTVGVFQIESRAQMQTLPRSRPTNLDDLVVEVAIIRPGPIQGNAVHPYLRRRQGKEEVAYLHPSLKPALEETLGVILYQEQVMKIAIDVAGFSAGESDGFRRAMGTWRSTREMEKLHARFVDGCMTGNGLTEEQAEELFRQVAAFASFGFNKSHAAAFARTAYESTFLKLFYPAQLVAGLINAQPMGFYPVEVLTIDA
jgi:hypothetical protein